jgi:hypothetical protein
MISSNTATTQGTYALLFGYYTIQLCCGSGYQNKTVYTISISPLRDGWRIDTLNIVITPLQLIESQQHPNSTTTTTNHPKPKSIHYYHPQSQ